MTRDDLIAFEQEIADEFNAGAIPYPVHLSDGNEDALIEIFRDVRPDDWVFGSWRMHYHALLKGVPRETLRAAIRRGESMALRFPEYRVFGSAIVGGMPPVALGVALSLKRAGGSEHVWCFVGDMTAETGGMHEAVKYAANHELPISFVIEDNGISVCTDTKAAWGTSHAWKGHVRHYDYRSKWPHAGAGVRVQF